MYKIRLNNEKHDINLDFNIDEFDAELLASTISNGEINDDLIKNLAEVFVGSKYFDNVEVFAESLINDRIFYKKD